MAHPPQVKARAIFLLMTGNTVGYVARECNVPKQTISRWKPQAMQLLRECVKTHPRYNELVELGRLLRRSIQNGTKTRAREVGVPTVPDTKKEMAGKWQLLRHDY